MEKHCWEVVGDGGRGLSGCRVCPAYRSGRDCWTLEDTPCSVNPAVCILIECPVYLANKGAIEHLITLAGLEDTVAAMDRIVAGWCWQSDRCPPALRERCPSYMHGEPCWEQPDPCPCSAGRGADSCLVCPIRVYHARFAMTLQG